MELTAIRRELPHWDGDAAVSDFLALLTAYDKLREQAESVEQAVRAENWDVLNDRVGAIVCEAGRELMKAMLENSSILQDIVMEALLSKLGMTAVREALEMEEQRRAFSVASADLGDLDDHPF